jgi:hypothetical protein
MPTLINETYIDKITYPQEPTENRNSSNSNESVSGDENATVKIPQVRFYTFLYSVNLFVNIQLVS